MSGESPNPYHQDQAPVQGDSRPLDHQEAWLRFQSGIRLVPVLSAGGDAITSVAVQTNASRALPGHKILRVTRFGHGWPQEHWADIIRALASNARNDSRVLRLHLEVFLRSGQDEMRSILQANGFVPVLARSYRHTLTLPVDMPDEALLAERKSLRKRLREAEKAGVAWHLLQDVSYAGRLEELQRIAMQRSGGNFRIPDWRGLIQMSAETPELSRIVGLFPSASAVAPEDLLGFAWGCMHGDHAEYRAAGTADVPAELRNVSISHPLLWDLIRWSRENGATWFDMGGVTLQLGSDDPLAGISAAKRVFSQTVEEVGEEWMLEPHPWKSRVAAGVSSLSSLWKQRPASPNRNSE